MEEQNDLRRMIVAITEELSLQGTATNLTDDTNLIGDGVIDSLGFLTLAARVQEKLGKEIPFDQYSPEEFTVFGRFVEICLRISSE